METPEQRLHRIKHTPMSLLTEEEIGLLDEDGQAFARRVQARIAREAACPGHQAVASPGGNPRRGWHPARCRHCDMDMSVDSGD